MYDCNTDMVLMSNAIFRIEAQNFSDDPRMFKFKKMKKYVQLIDKMYLENVSKYSKIKIQ